MSIKYKNTLQNAINLSYVNFVALDFETTGLNSRKDKIIEIGAVKVENGCIVDEYTTLVNPDEVLKDTVIAVTGITNDMLTDKPVITQVINELSEFIGVYPIVAHNANFDIAFYERALRHCVSNIVIDTLRIARKELSHLPSKKLSALAEYYGISAGHGHRALDDARTAAEVYLRLIGLGGVTDGKLQRKGKRKKRHRQAS